MKFGIKNEVRVVCIILLVAIWIVCHPLNAGATVQNVSGEGCVIYQSSIPLNVQKQQAFLLAKQNAIEKAGVYVRSFSKMQNYILAENEILPVASELTNIDIVKYSMSVDINEVKTVQAFIRAEFDDSRLDGLRLNDIEIYVSKYQALQQQYDELAQKNQAMKETLHAYELYRLGNQQLERKNYTNALYSYQQAAHISPSMTAPIVGMGNVYLHQRNFKLALYEFNKVLATVPRDLVALYGKARTLTEMGDYQAALIQYNVILTLNDQYGPAYLGRGEVNRYLGKAKQANRDFHMAEQFRNKQ